MNTFFRVYVNTQEHRRRTKRIEEYCREHSRFKSIALENPFFFSNKIEKITFLTRIQPLLLGPFKTVLCSVRVLDCHSPLFFRKIVRRDTGGHLALWPPVKVKWSISKNLRENRRL